MPALAEPTRFARPDQTNATSNFLSVPAPTGNKFYRLRKHLRESCYLDDYGYRISWGLA